MLAALGSGEYLRHRRKTKIEWMLLGVNGRSNEGGIEKEWGGTRKKWRLRNTSHLLRQLTSVRSRNCIVAIFHGPPSRSLIHMREKFSS